VSIYGDEYQYTPDGMVVLIGELRKMIAEGKPVTITVPMMDFILTQCEDVSSSFEAMTQYMVDEGVVSPAIAKRLRIGR
jgi:hypothetical protein